MNKILDLLTKDNCYSIGIRERNDSNGLLFEDNYSNFHILPISKGNWYADPIVFSYKDEDYLFCEVYDRKKDIGYIGVTVLDSLNPKPFSKVLDIGTHLSYPCVFEDNGTVYMIPETTTKKTVELYKAVDFPYSWEYVTNILENDEFADSTYYSDDRFKLLLTFQQYQGNGSITKLKVNNAEDIAQGSLGAFPSENYDFSNQSRGGGKLFIHNDQLFRPAQDCSKEYGYALNFFNVRIEDGRYTELFVKKVCPEQLDVNIRKKVIGIHTYALTDKYEIIDIKFDSPVFRYQVRRVLRFIKRKFFGKVS